MANGRQRLRPSLRQLVKHDENLPHGAGPFRPRTDLHRREPAEKFLGSGFRRGEYRRRRRRCRRDADDIRRGARSSGPRGSQGGFKFGFLSLPGGALSIRFAGVPGGELAGDCQRACGKSQCRDQQVWNQAFHKLCIFLYTEILLALQASCECGLGRPLEAPRRSRSRRESRAGVSPAQPRRKARNSHHQGLASLGRAGETPALRCGRAANAGHVPGPAPNTAWTPNGRGPATSIFRPE